MISLESLDVRRQAMEKSPEPGNRWSLPRGWPILEPAVLAILLCFRNQEVQFAGAGIPIKLGVPACLLEGVNTAGDTGKVIFAQRPNRLVDLFHTHMAPWYRHWLTG